MAKTERLRKSFFPQAIRLLNTTLFHKHSQTHCQLLYVQYHDNPSAHPLFTLLFIKSQYTVFCFLFLYILCFFAHLVVFLHISLSFAHLSIVFCTSYCFFAHLIVLHFLFIAHFILDFLLSYHRYALVLCYLYNLYLIVFALSTERTLIRLHFTSS